MTRFSLSSLVALTLLLSACGASAPGGSSGPSEMPPSTAADAVSGDRMAVVRQHVAAINAQDADAFIDPFIPEGVFGPGGDFRTSSSLFGNSLPLADVSLVEAWMAIHRAWGFEAELLTCSQDPGTRLGSPRSR